MRKIIVLAFLFACCISKIEAANPADAGSLLQNMKRLSVVGSVLYIAAHPDDENTRLLSYLNRERNLRTAYLSITRGDGGQNLVGKEQGELLGLLRTQELLAARSIDGAEQFFTRANDFGYSKNPEETFRFWNKDSVLADVVWVIRNFRPDVIICRFPTTGEGGHGHHTASAILALEAFDAAADPKRFPWQLQYTGVWQARRIFWNTFNFGGNNTTAPDQLQIDVGGFNPLLGKSYGELAAESRSMHKSQGFGSAKTRGSTIEYFKLLKGEPASKDIFEGIDVSWKRLPGAGAAGSLAEECVRSFDCSDPSGSLSRLVSLCRALRELPDSDESSRYWKKQKLADGEALLADCAGLWVEATAENYFSFPGNNAAITAQVINRSGREITLKKISWGWGDDTLMSLVLKNNILSTFPHLLRLPAHISYSSPYWLNAPHPEGYYVVSDQRLVGLPENLPAVNVTFEVEIGGLNLAIQRPVRFKSTDPIKGEVYRPFEILPPATVNFSSKAFVFGNSRAAKVLLQVKSYVDSVSGKLKIVVPPGWKAEPDLIELGILKRNHEESYETMITPPGTNSTGTLSASVLLGDSSVSRSIQRVEYDHVPFQFLLNESKAKLVSTDLKLGGLQIGYIPGAGDEVAEKLSEAGYRVTLLTRDDLAKKDLSVFDAVVTGVRAFNTNEWLQDFDQKLLQYVRQGGNLVVQYNTNNRIGPLTAKIFPYPVTISRERVTDEHAEVRFLKPDHPVLNYPNKISGEDFDGWIQERGIYFATEVDSAYEKIFSINDPGEKPQDGSLIIARYGKGNFAYSGLVFFRELPAGIPGAYRLFFNLLSLPKNN